MDNFLNNEIINNLENNLSNDQNNFLETTLGQTINSAIDIGLRWVLPDFIENEVIDIKDGLIKGGIKEGINQAINSAVELGKSTLGIFTGNFENLSQAQKAIKNGGIIDNISNILDSAINKATELGFIPYNVSRIIKQGKGVILDNVSKNIEDNFNTQINNIEKLSKYENNWKQYYEKQDFNGMEREYLKIKEKLKELMPLEETIKQARIIENIHSVIKNNDKKFELTKEQLELANMLV